ncbi:MAG: hypothetical protein ACOYD7_05645 [Raoultibacter sp.]
MTNSKQKEKVALWLARLAVALVFALNLQCALTFLIFPEYSLSAYGLSGTAGVVALQGIAVAFLMWNVTYPVVIANPLKHRIVFIIVLVQQAVGLIGESFIYLSMKDAPLLLEQSILRFIVFDGAGLMLMLGAFLWLQHQTVRTLNKS